MNLRRLVPFALNFFVAGSLVCPATPTDTEKTQNSARKFGGVTAKFTVLNPNLRTDQVLRVRLTLYNTLNRRVTFSFIHGTFEQHVRVYDQKKREVDQSTKAPIFEVGATKIDLGPHGRYETVETVDLPTFYALAPGRYYLRFYYKPRLLEDKHVGDRPAEMEWDPKYYPFRITK